MFVDVNLAEQPPQPRLAQPSDFGSFKLVATGSTAPEALGDALGELGTVDGDGAHAWLTLAGVTSLAGDLAGDAGWSQNFSGMVAYAQSKGWLSPAGDAIRAHIEWGDTSAGAQTQ
jgi:hypothetical protein